MCFTIHSEHQQVKIAKKDIVCYKTLGRDYYLEIDKNKIKGIFLSVHRGFVYDFNVKTIYDANTDKLRPIGRSIEKGIHSFSTKTEVLENQGSKEDIFKCIIPKGTEYYYNSDVNEYVSLKIKFIERLTFSLGKIK